MDIKTFSDNTKIIIPCIALVLLAQFIGKGMSVVDALPGAAVMFLVIIASIQIKIWLPKIPLPAFAGLSVGNSIDKLKSLSWKIVIVSLVVFTSAFFGAAVVAQLILKFQNII
ncbi:hypothetical protein OVA51_004566 [Escherichia coli]|nr:hypothetical protein [Escherichia coli]